MSGALESHSAQDALKARTAAQRIESFVNPEIESLLDVPVRAVEPCEHRVRLAEVPKAHRDVVAVAVRLGQRLHRVQ